MAEEPQPPTTPSDAQPVPPPEPAPAAPEPAAKPPRTDVDVDALFPMPQGKGLGHVADKWRLPPGPINTALIVLSIVGMVVLAPSLFRFALSPTPEGESLFDYRLLLKMILFVGCMGFFCAAAGFRFAHWFAGKITDLIFGMNDGPLDPKR